jgi:hypothetical protein
MMLLAPALVAGLGGCSKAPEVAPDPAGVQVHHHHAPHGGTVVVLGQNEYHVELVVDDAIGGLQAYILDDDLENFVRSTSASITFEATAHGSTHEVTLAAVANSETGETVGDTALFSGGAEWLKATPQFDGMLKSIAVRGTTYSDVKFNFPKGSGPAP